MLKKLRHKFILINMICVGVVLIAVLATVAIVSVRDINMRSYGALQMALSDGFNDKGRFEIKKRHDFPSDGMNNKSNSALITVEVDESGAIASTFYTGSVYMEDAALQDAVTQALTSGGNEGVVSDYSLRYMLGDVLASGNVRLALVDISTDLSEARNQIIILCLAAVIGLGAFFVISLFLSKLVLRPVEKAWQQQRQFVADASHELKTPLTVILANVGIISSHPEDKVCQQERWLDNTREEGLRMKELVDDMLFLSKADAAKDLPVLSDVSFSDVVENTCLTFEAVAFENGIEMEQDIASGVNVRGDKGQLTRLAGILVDNAIKYAGAHGKVRLALTRDKGGATLTVNNTGAAIPQADLEHIFERFYRADKSRARKEGGYGLGLAIARSIVDSHKGSIDVTSTDESGTTFSVRLP